MPQPPKVFPFTYWDFSFHSYIGLINLLEKANWKTIHVAPYPEPGSPQFAQELEMLWRMQHDPERTQRTPDILAEDKTPTPQFQRVLLFNDRSHPKTYELTSGVATLVGRCIVMYYKNHFNRARPSQYEPRLRPLLDIPGHPAYPSGHSTQTHLVASILADLIQDKTVQAELFNIAWRVAENREWAGLHYRSDSEAGRQLAHDLLPFVRESFAETFALARQEW